MNIPGFQNNTMMILKALILSMVFYAFMLFEPREALARNNYFNTLVPTALLNLGYINTASWVGDCANCHRTSAGGQAGNPDLNTMFGADFYAANMSMGTNFDQATVQMMIQAIEMLDSDGDTHTNQAEFIARTNPNNPLSKPATVGGGGATDDPNEFFEDGRAVGKASGQKIIDGDAAYQLSSCNVEEMALRKMKPLTYSQAGGVFGLFLLPVILILGLFRRPD